MRAPDLGWVELRAGDAAFLPLGLEHVLACEPGAATRPLPDLRLEAFGERTYRLVEGGGGAVTRLFCCSVEFPGAVAHPLLASLPPTLLVRDPAGDEALPQLLELMAREVQAERIGTATILTRLADTVIAQLVRAWIEGRREEAGSRLAAIRDPRLGPALAAMHREPDRPWTVGGLARLAGSSRSVFAERFTRRLGVAPLTYLARWRMHQAGRWLAEGRLSVAQVGAHLGYQSEPGFSRAYKRIVGLPPRASGRSARS